MIKNDKQYKITKSLLNKFKKNLDLLKVNVVNDLLNQIMIDSLESQIESLKKEILEYEELKIGKPHFITYTLEEFPESLIKARIACGLTQNQLAKKAGLKEQQIQRYEATNYKTANFEKLIDIAKNLSLQFEPSKLILNVQPIKVKNIDPNIMLATTAKLQSKRTLFNFTP